MNSRPLVIHAKTTATVGAALLVLAGGALAGCAKPDPPTLTPVSAAIVKITPAGIDLTVALTATNPNTVDLTAQGVTAHVVLGSNVDLGTVTSSDAITLPAGKTTPFTEPLSVKWESLAAIAGLAQTSGDVPFAIDGTVAMGGKLVNVALPFHLAGTVTHLQLVTATLQSIPGLPHLR